MVGESITTGGFERWASRSLIIPNNSASASAASCEASARSIHAGAHDFDVHGAHDTSMSEPHALHCRMSYWELCIAPLRLASCSSKQQQTVSWGNLLQIKNGILCDAGRIS